MRTLILLFLTVLPLSSWGHEYYFGFAEIAYNQEESRFEGTLILSAHDVEDWLQSKGVLIGQMEELQPQTDLMTEVQNEIFQGFEMSIDGQSVAQTIIGVEVLTNGMVHFYFHSDPIVLTSSIDFRFDLLMDYFPEQQNKVTYLKEGQSASLVFTKLSPTGKIDVL